VRKGFQGDVVCPKCKETMEVHSGAQLTDIETRSPQKSNSLNLGIYGKKGEEAQLFEMASAEMKQGRRNDGLWAKALADTAGDEDRATWRYLQLRVETLKEQKGYAVRATAEHLVNALEQDKHAKRIEKRNRFLDELQSACLILLWILAFWISHQMLKEEPIRTDDYYWVVVILATLIFVYSGNFILKGLIWLLRGAEGRYQRDLEIREKKEKERRAVLTTILKDFLKIIVVIGLLIIFVKFLVAG
jgi:hypothetical protein